MAVPLRKLQPCGTPYQRRPEIEAALDGLVLLRGRETADRCEIVDPGNADHLPSECLLHLVRASRSDNSDAHFTALFRALRRRVLARLPRTDVGRGPDGKILDSQTNIRITEAVMDRFQELLMLDRRGYEDRLDYFEVNFDDAGAFLRLTAGKKGWEEGNGPGAVTYGEETSGGNPGVKETAA